MSILEVFFAYFQEASCLSFRPSRGYLPPNCLGPRRWRVAMSRINHHSNKRQRPQKRRPVATLASGEDDTRWSQRFVVASYTWMLETAASEVDEVDGPLWIFVSLSRPNNLVITRNRSRAFGAMKSWKSLGVTGPKRSPPSTGGRVGDFHPKRGGGSFRWNMDSWRKKADIAVLIGLRLKL